MGHGLAHRHSHVAQCHVLWRASPVLSGDVAINELDRDVWPSVSGYYRRFRRALRKLPRDRRVRDQADRSRLVRSISTGCGVPDWQAQFTET